MPRPRRTSPGPTVPEADVPRTVPVSLRARYAEVTRLTDAACRQGLNEEYAQSELDTSRLDSAELKRAFDEVPECR